MITTTVQLWAEGREHRGDPHQDGAGAGFLEEVATEAKPRKVRILAEKRMQRKRLENLPFLGKHSGFGAAVSHGGYLLQAKQRCSLGSSSGPP